MPLPARAVGAACDSPPMPSNTCQKCLETKPITEFFMRSGRPRGTCKLCWNADVRKWRAANRERVLGYSRAQYAKDGRRRRTLAKYGLTEESWQALLDAQGGVCAVCQGPPQMLRSGGAVGEPTFHVDHDHDSGAVRGLLCGLCNRMLGQALDDPARLLAGARYLQETR